MNTHTISLKFTAKVVESDRALYCRHQWHGVNGVMPGFVVIRYQRMCALHISVVRVNRKKWWYNITTDLIEGTREGRGKYELTYMWSNHQLENWCCRKTRHPIALWRPPEWRDEKGKEHLWFKRMWNVGENLHDIYETILTSHVCIHMSQGDAWEISAGLERSVCPPDTPLGRRRSQGTEWIWWAWTNQILFAFAHLILPHSF